MKVTLAGQSYDTLLLGVPDAENFAASLLSAAGLQGRPAGALRETEVSFGAGTETLAGTLAVPERPGPVPAVLLITGSGPLDRNADHKNLPIGVSRQLARALAAQGIATYRYDKRGVGASSGNFYAAGLNDNIDDAAAALTMLRGRPEVDPSRVFVLGHSEGAVIAGAVAARGVPVAGVILIAGTAGTGEEVLRWQLSAIMPTFPAPVRGILRLFRVDLAKKQKASFDRMRASSKDSARIGGRRQNVKWMREFLDHNTANDLTKIQAPVLAITGSKDLQVNPDWVGDIERLAPGPVTGLVVPDLSHILRAQPGRPSLSSYKKDVSRPVDDRVTGAILGWVKALEGRQ